MRSRAPLTECPTESVSLFISTQSFRRTARVHSTCCPRNSSRLGSRRPRSLAREGLKLTNAAGQRLWHYRCHAGRLGGESFDAHPFATATSPLMLSKPVGNGAGNELCRLRRPDLEAGGSEPEVGEGA